MSLYAQNGKQGDETHEYVDLGLPSGTLWATCNVGASKPEEYGDYFAWGETKPKETYNWSNYKWMNVGQSDFVQINKYTVEDNETNACWYSGSTFIGDSKTELDLEDDAATVNWGNDWCMPSFYQIKELYNPNYTITECITQNGINGQKLTSKKNGNFIFLPSAGVRDDGQLCNLDSFGYYWSRNVNSGYSESALMLSLGLGYFETDLAVVRYKGQSVRPVRREKVSATTSIDGITANKAAIKDGKYISNGNLIIIKDGKQYNANGMRK